MENLKNIINDDEYFKFLNEIKNDIITTRRKVLTQANNEVILMYHRIGKGLIKNTKYGNSFIDTLAKDLKLEFPDMQGLSARNLRYMKKFAKEFEYDSILQHDVAKLPWTTITTIMDKIKDEQERLWYAEKTLENLWSRTILEHQIGTDLYSRQALLDNKISNYKETLPIELGKRALEMLKDPYVFDIGGYGRDVLEKDVEDALVSNITNLLLEFGNGFAFVGRQYHLEIEGEDYYIDLLFYNLNLKCYVVVELKTVKFIPEFAGKLNFYLNAVDMLLKKEDDNPTIGILLCRDEHKLTAELALKDINKPIGVAEYKYLQEIPEYLANNLPSIETLEKRLNNRNNDSIKE